MQQLLEGLDYGIILVYQVIQILVLCLQTMVHFIYVKIAVELLGRVDIYYPKHMQRMMYLLSLNNRILLSFIKMEI